jgi:hypothetical protein
LALADCLDVGVVPRQFDVQDAKRAGRTLDEVVNTWKVPERYMGYTQPQPASLRANVQVIWDETR